MCGRKTTSSACLYVSFKDAAATEIYTLSQHDALPIVYGVLSGERGSREILGGLRAAFYADDGSTAVTAETRERSEEHTSELQSRQYLVCRLLLEKKKPSHTLDPCTPARDTQKNDLTQI